MAHFESAEAAASVEAALMKVQEPQDHSIVDGLLFIAVCTQILPYCEPL